MQRLEVSCVVRRVYIYIYTSLAAKGLMCEGHEVKPDFAKFASVVVLASVRYSIIRHFSCARLFDIFPDNTGTVVLRTTIILASSGNIEIVRHYYNLKGADRYKFTPPPPPFPLPVTAWPLLIAKQYAPPLLPL